MTDIWTNIKGIVAQPNRSIPSISQVQKLQIIPPADSILSSYPLSPTRGLAPLATSGLARRGRFVGLGEKESHDGGEVFVVFVVLA